LLFLAPDDFPIAANLLEPMWKIKAQGNFGAGSAAAGSESFVSIGFTSPDDLAKQVAIGGSIKALGGKTVAQVETEKTGHPSRPLQRRHVHVQVHSADSLDLQRHVFSENFGDRP